VILFEVATPERPTAPRRPAPRHPTAAHRPTARGPVTPGGLLAVQSAAGNAAATSLLRRPAPVMVARCAPDDPQCACPPEVKAQAEGEQTEVQRDELPGPSLPGPSLPGPSFPAGGGFTWPARPDILNFTNRTFSKGPGKCPSCHSEPDRTPWEFKDHEATEPRLVSWAIESGRSLQSDTNIVELQLRPGTEDTIVDNFGVSLVNNVTHSGEFDGSTAARQGGAEAIRRNWPRIHTDVRGDLSGWYREEFAEALGRTPAKAEMLTRPDWLDQLLHTPKGNQTVPLGRHGATAKIGDRVNSLVLDDISFYSISFHLHDNPHWYYTMTVNDFLKTDPFTNEVLRQVYDNTKFAQYLLPFMLKAAAFGLGFSSSICLVIAGIAMDEFAEEMTRDLEGKPPRTLLEVLGSAGSKLLIDRVMNKLLGPGGHAVEGAAPKLAAKLEQVADKAVPAIRKELAAAEQPLVKGALEGGTARKVTDKTLKAEGYTVEVAVVSGGERHMYRLGGDGKWCRFSTPVCGLDLGSDVAASATKAASFTKSKLADTRELLGTVERDMAFLGDVYTKMKKAGKVDLTLLSAEERKLLDELADGGASKLTLAELRDLPRTLGLKRELTQGIAAEARLVDQLRREQRPLYEVMRAASPSHVARQQTLRLSRGLDAATGVAPRSGVLHVDHIVPVREMVDMPGFSALRFEDQLLLVNDVKNLQTIDALANSSRGDWSWAEWPQARIFYDDVALKKMRALEEDARKYLAERIAALGKRK
jgi:hypothetical protein